MNKPDLRLNIVGGIFFLIVTMIWIIVYTYYGDMKGFVNDCEYVSSKDCPCECFYALKVNSIDTSKKYDRSGLKRFIERYGEDWRLVTDGIG